MSAIFSLLSAAKANQRSLEATSNNIANVNTTGFKADRPVFKEHLDKAVGVDLESEEENFADNQFLTPFHLGSSTYVQTDDVLSNMEKGGYALTENDTDLALANDGFFTVETPYGKRYTRNGHFGLDRDGFLVTREGHYVLGNNGPMQVNDGKLNVTEDGLVQVDRTFVDKLLIVDFDEPSKLTKTGNSYFAVADELQTPGSSKRSTSNRAWSSNPTSTRWTRW